LEKNRIDGSPWSRALMDVDANRSSSELPVARTESPLSFRAAVRQVVLGAKGREHRPYALCRAGP
jgi:hypothetical protein